ncbi:MoaD/ThiS family protein [Curvivirga aplysinae]|uniref:MoaD/ThiS family protein n=1 Tax=Curvivirga aplysinae TaxID=2529852 RepID=UPI0012BC60A5|nr:MoaD/ThiS family protein [Curvivirga aplysinae]MTI09747.1 MoaD/ThiS family protein [Curvivirga aplysinae]
MVQVVLSGIMKTAVDDQAEIEIEAKNIKQLLDALARDYPKMEPYVKKGLAVSINGVIYRDSLYQKIPEDAEIFVIPRLAGG